MSSERRMRIRDVMKEAWRIRRRAAAEQCCPVSKILFSDCLKMAWELIRVSLEKIDVWKVIGARKGERRKVVAKKILDALKAWHPNGFYGATEGVWKFVNAVTCELITLRKKYA